MTFVIDIAKGFTRRIGENTFCEKQSSSPKKVVSDVAGESNSCRRLRFCLLCSLSLPLFLKSGCVSLCSDCNFHHPCFFSLSLFLAITPPRPLFHSRFLAVYFFFSLFDLQMRGWYLRIFCLLLLLLCPYFAIERKGVQRF